MSKEALVGTNKDAPTELLNIRYVEQTVALQADGAIAMGDDMAAVHHLPLVCVWQGQPFRLTFDNNVPRR